MWKIIFYILFIVCVQSFSFGAAPSIPDKWGIIEDYKKNNIYIFSCKTIEAQKILDIVSQFQVYFYKVSADTKQTIEWKNVETLKTEAQGHNTNLLLYYVENEFNKINESYDSCTELKQGETYTITKEDIPSGMVYLDGKGWIHRRYLAKVKLNTR